MQTFLLAIVLIIIVALLVAFGYKKFNGGRYDDDYEFLEQFNQLVDNINKYYTYQSPKHVFFEKYNTNLNDIIEKFPRLITITKAYWNSKPCVAAEADKSTHEQTSSQFKTIISWDIKKGLEYIIDELEAHRDYYKNWHAIPDSKIKVFKKFYEEFEPISLSIHLRSYRVVCPICSDPITGLRTKPALRKEYDPEDDE